MTLSSAHAVPWPAVVKFHREVLGGAGGAVFALPVTASGTERWSSLTGFEPGQFAGPWEIDLQALASTHLQQDVQTGSANAFIGGPCWFRWTSDDEQHRDLEWIPLIYREVSIENQDGRLGIVPVQDGWQVCPLVIQYLEQHNIPTAEPLDETLPELLSIAETKAAGDGQGLTEALIDAFGLVVPELGALLTQGRDDFPVDGVAFEPSTWVLFRQLPGDSGVAQRILSDYALLERRLAGAGQNTGGLGLLEGAPVIGERKAHEISRFVSLNHPQSHAVETAFAGRPVTVIGVPPDCTKTEVVLSILLNAWANSTSVLFTSGNSQAVDDLCQRLKSFESEFELAVRADEQPSNKIDEALARAIDLITARRGESHYGGSLSDRKHGQLIKKKQILREMLDSQVPQRLSQAIEAALASHAAQRQALATLKSRREELVGELGTLGIEDAPDTFGERVIDPLRKWRNGIDATKRLIKDDAQRDATSKRELSAALGERDSALADCQIESASGDPEAWLLAKPGFESFGQALLALSEKLQNPIEDELTDAAWEEPYDEWSSSEDAADWERKARETVALLRPAGISLKEKAGEVQAAREALDSAERTVQQTTKTSSFDVRREDLDEWAAAYAEVCALPRAKLAFLPQSKSAELIRQLEKVESRFRISFPVHLWSSIGTLNDNGRSRLSPVIERGREWHNARDDWDRLGSVRDEIESQTEALRRRLDGLGARALSMEVTPTGCAAIASKLNEKASLAASAAAAWSKRETRERLPGELLELATQIRAAGAGTPIKERWMTGSGASLIAALDSVAGNPGVETFRAVRSEILGPAAADPILENWKRAYQAEGERVAIAEEMERIPPKAARLNHWKTRRPASLPGELEAADAFEGDDSHPVWVFLQKCETWNQSWASYRDDDAPALEQTANTEGAGAIRHIGEAAQTLPNSKERTWLEAFANSPAVNESWPVDKLTELATLWQPDRLQAALEKIDEQLERSTFESAREKWLDRVATDSHVLPSLNELREHYKRDCDHIEETGYAHFKQVLKAQPVWVTAATSAQSIPMQPGLFDLLVIDEATQCSLTDMLPLIFRAKRLIVVGDPEQESSFDSIDAEAEHTLAARFGVEAWAELLGHAGNDVYKTAVASLPRRQEDVISLVQDKRD